MCSCNTLPKLKLLLIYQKTYFSIFNIHMHILQRRLAWTCVCNISEKQYTDALYALGDDFKNMQYLPYCKYHIIRIELQIAMTLAFWSFNPFSLKPCIVVSLWPRCGANFIKLRPKLYIKFYDKKLKC